MPLPVGTPVNGGDRNQARWNDGTRTAVTRERTATRGRTTNRVR
ncbi:hypothetical protein ACFQFD_09590 [Halobaculum halobium]|uniref:Uncharacterized protein n=1 Tax=Halobaculum halobium TaxID=3032281 RepID=A0ABD5TA45_9EURY